MDEDLTAARQAERRAADLHYVGWEVGAGATIWARVAQDALALHESAREKFVENTADLEAWERFHGSAFMLIVALAHVLGFERSVRSLTGDAERAKARARFDAACPHAKAIRDLAAHLDDYAVGEGWLQKPTAEGAPPSIREQNLAVLLFWADTDGTFIDLGEKRVECARLRRQWPSWRRSSSA